MKWEQVVTHDDAYASLARAHHRREVAARRKSIRHRVRWLLAPLTVAGFALLGWAIVTMDAPSYQAAKVVLGTALIVPWLATFDLLGEAQR